MLKSKWLEIIRHSVNAKISLFCFHHGGGGALFFSSWQGFLPDWINLYAIQLPGHETRFDEPLIHDLEKIVTSLTHNIVYETHIPFCFFGHSMGGLLAYELCKSLIFHQKPMPKLLIVSACRAPHTPPRNPLHQLSDQEFTQGIKNYNGTPEDFFNENHELLELLLPVMRADFTISETYVLDNSQIVSLNIPIIALSGENDPTVFVEDIMSWQQYTQSEFRMHSIPGDHFFIKSTQKDVGKLLTEILKGL